MALIAGASAYYYSSSLSNSHRLTVSTDNLLGRNTGSLLDAGRRINRNGIGLSSSARQLTQKFLNDSGGLANTLLSASADLNTTDNLKTRILAIRARFAADDIEPDVFLTTAERDAKAKEKAAASSGSNVDIEA